MSKTTLKNKAEVTPEETTKLPIKVKFNRAFSLPIRMQGHASAAVTVQFREGHIEQNADLIKALLQHQAPVTVLE